MKKLVFILIFLIFIADRYFKDFSSIQKTFNYGISFSIGINFLFLFMFLGIFIVILILVIRNLSLQKSEVKTALSMMLIGGGSNLLDRYIYGGVVDYLNFFGIFRNNLSDYLIFVGLLIMFYSELIFKKYNNQINGM